MKEKIAWFVRALSLGKYNTILYNKTGSNSMSSLTGGIITMMIGLLISFYSVFILWSIFGKENYNIDLKSQEIRAYDSQIGLGTDVIFKNKTLCSSGNCKDIRLRDWNKLTRDIYFVLGTGNYTIDAVIENFNEEEPIVVSNQIEVPWYGSGMIFFFQLKVTKNLTEEKLDELLFY